MSKKRLIIGSDGLIGGALMRYLQNRGLPVVGTSRKHRGEALLHLDMASSEKLWPPLLDFDAAVICGAVTSDAACRSNPAGTHRVNVNQTILLAEKLIRQGTFVVFLSSNAVFDGSRPFFAPADITCPLTEYGRQKEEAENKLLSLCGNSAIVRMTKVVHARLPLFCDWIETLKRGTCITPFSDYLCAPVHLNAVTRAITSIMEKKISGIWHLSAAADVSYEKIATKIAVLNDLNPSLITPISCKGGALLGHIPKHTTLDTSQTEPYLDFIARDPLEAIL